MARGRKKVESDTAVDTDPEFATVGDSRPATAPAGPRVRPVKRARLGVVVLSVLLTEVVLIAAGANQAVAKHVVHYAGQHPKSLPGNIAQALLVLRWSFAPVDHHSDLWHAELITVGLTLLVSMIFVALVVHGPVNWVRAFFGTWFAVTIATTVSAVAALVLSDLEQSADFAFYGKSGDPSLRLSLSEQIQQATFEYFLSYAFVAGLAFGVVTALIVATVVALARRTDPVPVAVAAAPEPLHNPESPQPFFGDESARRSAYGTARYPDTYVSPDRRAASAETTTLPAVGYGSAQPFPDSDAANRTTALPRVGTDQPPVPPTPPPADSGSTSELPRTEAIPAPAPEPERTQAWPAQPQSDADADADADSERTAAFPVPPDDEDLGHHPHHNDD